MSLSLDVIAFGTPEVHAARSFYTSALSAAAKDDGQPVNLDMHGAGEIGLLDAQDLATNAGAAPESSGFCGYIVSYVVNQPAEVRSLLDAAARGGAKILKPARGSLFGGFSAAFQAPDGAIWKLSSANRKDNGPAANPPRPSETAALLGVAEPKASKVFYEALGMTVDRDYGNKYIDFRPTPGGCRLGLMERKTLAKDVGVQEGGSGFRTVVFTNRAGSRQEVDELLAAAESAGGRIAVAAREIDEGGYSGHFADPDGFLWRVVSG